MMLNKSIALTLADAAAKRGVIASADTELTAHAKTIGYYQRVLWRAVRGLYSGKIDEYEFIDVMIALSEGQMSRAYREGLRNVGYDPKDMTDLMDAELRGIIDSEQNFVLDFAQRILDAAESGADVSQFRAQVDTWTNRYTDVVNRAQLTGAPKEQMFEWALGPTEHCATCVTLAGQVASGNEWQASGYLPQRPPNSALECGGWRCQCQLTPTDKKRTGIAA